METEVVHRKALERKEVYHGLTETETEGGAERKGTISC
jgi:hypothetical protein